GRAVDLQHAVEAGPLGPRDGDLEDVPPAALDAPPRQRGAMGDSSAGAGGQAGGMKTLLPRDGRAGDAIHARVHRHPAAPVDAPLDRRLRDSRLPQPLALEEPVVGLRPLPQFVMHRTSTAARCDSNARPPLLVTDNAGIRSYR